MLICKYRIILVLNESEHSWDDKLSGLYTPFLFTTPPVQLTRIDFKSLYTEPCPSRLPVTLYLIPEEQKAGASFLQMQ